MDSKLLVIVASGDRDKVLTAMMYANSALKRGGFDDVRVVFFGPSEQLVADDEEIREKAESLAEATECIACKAISDRRGISGEIEELGVKVEYVGSIVSGLIGEGYVPMVW